MTATRIDDGGAAFPQPTSETPWLPGNLTVRDFFAAQCFGHLMEIAIREATASKAVLKLMADEKSNIEQAVARVAYRNADALLAARKAVIAS